MAWKEKLFTLIGKRHYNKTESDTKYAEKSHTHTGYLTSADISNKLDKNQGGSNGNKNVVTDSNGNITTENKVTVPTKTSDLTNDSGFLTTHQDITGKADITQSITNGDTTHSPSGDAVYDALTGKSDTTHTHSAYVNPVIVDNLTTDDASKTLSAKQGKVLNDNKLDSSTASSTYLSKSDASSNYVAKENGKGLFTGSYTDLSNKPNIPSKTSDLTNDGDGSNAFIKEGDSRLTNSRTPTSHTHGDISNTGAIGSASGKPLITTTNGKITVGEFGSGSGKFVEGNDSRLSDARTPTAHNQASSTITDSNTYSNIGNTANTLDNILSNINTKLGALANIELVEVTSNKGTASASTMNKLYLVAESNSATNDNYEIFVTVRTGTTGNYSYAWEKVDTARIDLSNYVLNSDSRLTDSRTPKSHTHGNISNDGKIGSASGKIITTDTNGVLVASDSITKSKISDFPSSMTPSSHTHGDISNTGSIGSTANKPLITTTNGKITTGSFGNSANTFCQGNDSRLSDARTPTTHTHTKSEISDFPSIPTASSTTPSADTSNGSVGTGTTWAKADHTHPKSTLYAESSHTHTKSQITDFPSSMTPSSHTHGNVQNDGTVKVSNTVQKSKNLVTDANGYVNVEDKITKTSQLTNDGDGSNAFIKEGDTRLTNARTPTSHTHGNISNDGKIGSTSGLPVITTTNGAITTGNFGSSAGTFCQGNDSRLSDARTPTSHSHGSLANGGTLNSDISSVNKIAVTDSSNNLKTISQLPYSKISGTPTIPTKTSDLINDADDERSGVTYVKSNDSRLTDSRTPTSHTHTKSQISDFPSLSTVATSGSYNDLTNKPTIPSAYTHPTPSGLGGAKTSGLYKITTDAQGHITSATSVTASDILALANIEIAEMEVTFTDNTTQIIQVLTYTESNSN